MLALTSACTGGKMQHTYSSDTAWPQCILHAVRND